jgi:hypothetical protein
VHPASPTEYGFQPKAPIDPPVEDPDAGPGPINVLLQSRPPGNKLDTKPIVNDCEQASISNEFRSLPFRQYAVLRCSPLFGRLNKINALTG